MRMFCNGRRAAVNRVIGEDDFRVDTGRASGGKTFVRVLHTPTGVFRLKVGFEGRESQDVATDLRSSIVDELFGLGWSQD